MKQKQQNKIEYKLKSIHRSIDNIEETLVIEAPIEAKMYQIGKELTITKQKTMEIQDVLWETKEKNKEKKQETQKKEKQGKNIDQAIEKGTQIVKKLIKQRDTQGKHTDKNQNKDKDLLNLKEVLSNGKDLENIKEEQKNK